MPNVSVQFKDRLARISPVTFTPRHAAQLLGLAFDDFEENDGSYLRYDRDRDVYLGCAAGKLAFALGARNASEYDRFERAIQTNIGSFMFDVIVAISWSHSCGLRIVDIMNILAQCLDWAEVKPQLEAARKAIPNLAERQRDLLDDDNYPDE